MVQSPLEILIVEDTPERQEVLRNLYKDHAWIVVNTARRAIRLIDVYDFDLISLDYNLDREDCGDTVANFISTSRNSGSTVFVHSMNAQGVARIKEFLPNSIAVPFSKIIRDNQTFKRFRQEINRGIDVDWSYIFRRTSKLKGI